jgi:4-hydroxythreonine-4-phosphate dehydrogenase
MALPRIAITMGEPAGIGPDLVAGLLQQRWSAQLSVIGDGEVLAQRAELLGLRLPRDGWDLEHCPCAVPVRAGHLDSRNAPAVVHMLERGCDGCLDGRHEALVTAPVQKSVINDAGVAFSGHTEFLAERCGTPNPVMLLVADSLRVALATTHLPLREVPDAITPQRLRSTLRVLAAGLADGFGMSAPRILVCGLNPHAGEGGHLGREEIDLIIPCLERLRGEGLRVFGPVPADTAFTPERLVEVDAVLAMYHDQGLPVLKHAGFGRAVNVTLGLPIIRTSVDHGTALDLAGGGNVDPGSLHAALRLAIEMADRRRVGKP